MKALRKKVILSAVVLLFALVATIGSTYAWFTVSNTVSASSVSLKVQSTESLLIKVAAANAVATDATSHTSPADYKSYLAEGDITTVYTGISTATLKPVTAIQAGYAAINANTLKPLAGVTSNDKRNLGSALDLDLSDDSTDINTDTGGVVQMKFWVMSQGAAQVDLYLSALSFANTTGTGKADDAMRMSVYVGDYNASNNNYIYATNLDYDFAFTAGLAGYYSGEIYSGTTLLGFNKISDLTKAYSGSGSAAPNFAEMPSHYDLTSSSVITTLAQNTPKLITVTIYLEGWDKDTTNSIMLEQTEISFSFSITPSS
ncbi:MAG: hypothetical protein GX904_04820 [Acholeplasmataceae bacterium]|mgnify:CR=1 FL=1|nr:hypothetical protein [Acholeplasmataceae bacterium]